ncbi:MAG: nicotinate phosphoribosyltransferase [Clostridia bacterium]
MRNLSMMTDYYELTMSNGYFKKNMSNTVAVFDLFFRPYDESSYCIAAGLEQAVEYIMNLHFSKQDIEFLRSTNEMSKEFLEYLSNFKFSGNVYAVEEGAVVFPYEPVITIEAPIIEAQIIESALLNIVNFQTLIATKSARVCRSAGNGSVLEFGLRRAQAPDAAIYGARAAVIGGCSSTSNVLTCQMFNLTPKGTHAHSWVMSFDNELESFRAYAELYPNNCMLLVDTYDTLKSGVPNAIKVFDELNQKGIRPVGIRLDSGDLAYLSKKARAMLDQAGYPDAKIFVSGDLDEYVIQSLNNQGARIDVYGVGTRLITSNETPSLGGVYKLAALKVNGEYIPKMKISDNPIKITNPCRKTFYRLISKVTNKALADIICVYDEVIDENKPLIITHPAERWKRQIVSDFYLKPMMNTIISNGKLVVKLPDIYKIKQKAKDNLAQFWEEHTRNVKSEIYKVDLSDKLYNIKTEFITKSREENI